MNGNCDVCLIDLVERPAERLSVQLIYPYPYPRAMTLDLCADHLALAHDPTNDIAVVTVSA